MTYDDSITFIFINFFTGFFCIGFILYNVARVILGQNEPQVLKVIPLLELMSISLLKATPLFKLFLANQTFAYFNFYMTLIM